jgi:hypothetical protein
MPTFTVNEAIELLDGIAGKDIKVRGLFTFDFENVSLSHVPLHVTCLHTAIPA